MEKRTFTIEDIERIKKIEELQFERNICAKAYFLCRYGHEILSKIEDETEKERTEDALRHLLLGDISIEKSDFCNEIIDMTLPHSFEENQELVREIIFHICKIIHQLNLLPEDKIVIRDKLRKYIQCFYKEDELDQTSTEYHIPVKKKEFYSDKNTTSQ